MIKNKLAQIFLVLSLFIYFSSFGQSLLIPLNYQHTLRLNELIQGADSTIIHTSFKPLLESNLDGISSKYDLDTSKYYYKVTQKLYKENLIIIEDDDFSIAIDPVFNFSFGQDFQDSTSKNLYRNTRGVQIHGEIGKKLGFYSSFYENQSIEPTYINTFIKETGVSPGQGRVKQYKGDKGFDFGMASGYLSYSPQNWINLQLGHHKNFIGNGYRSMLWSDNSFNYPFLKSTFSFLENTISYTSLFGLFQSLNRLKVTNSTEAIFERKGGTIHYLNFVPHKSFEIGIFESLLYQRKDTTKVTSVPYNYFLPLIGLNSAIFGLDDKNDATLGLNLKINLSKSISLYGQIALNQTKNKDFGYQIGFNLFSPFGIKNLYFLGEFNASEKPDRFKEIYSFSHFHYNQSTAHPLNKNFKEILGILNYQYGKLFVQLKGIGQTKKIFNNSPTQEIISPTTVDVFIVDANIGIKLNKRTNAQILLGLLQREEIWKNYSTKNTSTTYFYISLKTSLMNLYYDY